jgi:mannitol operon transcriptional antiterminator
MRGIHFSCASLILGVGNMKLTLKQQAILLELLKQGDEFVSLSELAEKLTVSVRTIQREIKGMEKLILEDFSLTLERQIGEGIRLEGSETQKEYARKKIEESKRIDFFPFERKTLILQTLLTANQPIKLMALALQCKVTTATVSSDLDEIENWLKTFQLEVSRKRGSGVEILGTESSKRQAMSSLLADNLSTDELMQLLRNRNASSNTEKNISQRLLGLVDQDTLQMIERELNKIFEQMKYPLADSAYIGLSVHLALALERIKNGDAISFNSDTLKELQGSMEYKVASEIVKRLEKEFGFPIPVDEIGYVTMHLMGSKLRSSFKDELVDIEHSLEIKSKAKEMLDRCALELKTTWDSDNEALEGLTTHLGPALFRIKTHMSIRNPMLPLIREKYNKLFLVVKKTCMDVFSQIDIPDEEIGYIVMHVGAALHLSDAAIIWPNAFVICSSGIGTSRMLAKQLRQEFPQFEKIENISMFELDKVDTDHSILISTVPLPKIDSEHYVLISPFLTARDKEKVHQYLRQIRFKLGLNRESIDLNPVREKMNKIHAPITQMKKYTHIVYELIRNFQLLSLENKGITKQTSLKQICSIINPQLTEAEVELLVVQLLHREEMGGIGIPNANLALYHSRSDMIKKISFHICTLREPYAIHSMTGEEIQVEKLLFLLSPSNVSKESLEILSEISILLLNKTAIDIFQTGTRENIVFFLEQHFSQYIIQKIQRRDDL